MYCGAANITNKRGNFSSSPTSHVSRKKKATLWDDDEGGFFLTFGRAASGDRASCDASSRAEPLDEEAFLYKKIREQFVHLVVPTTDETILEKR